jgi:hypothetical protein
MGETVLTDRPARARRIGANGPTVGAVVGKLGPDAARTAIARPGTVVGAELPPKPEPGTTPWRSKLFVPARWSADGNGYARGDTIPEAEARRQGLIGRPAVRTRTVRHVCTRCQGTTREPGHPANHRRGLDCTCPFNRPCVHCGGTGREPEEGSDAHGGS